MELHDTVFAHVGHAEGGCSDVGTLDLKGFVLVSKKELRAALAEAFETGFKEGWEARDNGADIDYEANAREYGLEHAATAMAKAGK